MTLKWYAVVHSTFSMEMNFLTLSSSYLSIIKSCRETVMERLYYQSRLIWDPLNLQYGIYPPDYGMEPSMEPSVLVSLWNSPGDPHSMEPTGSQYWYGTHWTLVWNPQYGTYWTLVRNSGIWTLAWTLNSLHPLAHNPLLSEILWTRWEDKARDARPPSLLYTPSRQSA